MKLFFLLFILGTSSCALAQYPKTHHIFYQDSLEIVILKTPDTTFENVIFVDENSLLHRAKASHIIYAYKILHHWDMDANNFISSSAEKEIIKDVFIGLDKKEIKKEDIIELK